MKIKDVEIFVVLGKLEEQDVYHCISSIDEPDINTLRKTLARALDQADQNGVDSIAFGMLGCAQEGLSYQHSSKVMAQQVFKYIKEIEEPVIKRIVFVVDNEVALKVFDKNIKGYLTYMSNKGLLGPYVTVDGIVEYQGGIVLIERSNPPLGFALPGGFVDYNESVEDAVVREIKEETNLEFRDIKLLKVSSDPDRDPRFHTVSIIFHGKGSGELCAGDDAAKAHVVAFKDIPAQMAFDHRQIICDYLQGIGDRG